MSTYVTTGAQDACECKQQCEKIEYNHALSSAVTSEYAVNYMADVQMGGVPPDVIRKNFVVLDIFCSDIYIEEMVTKVAYTFLALLCDVGGAMGLILGSTLLTLFEITDFAIITLFDIILYFKAKHTQRRISMHNKNGH